MRTSGPVAVHPAETSTTAVVGGSRCPDLVHQRKVKYQMRILRRRVNNNPLRVLGYVCALGASLPLPAYAVTSGELYTTNAYGYGRFEARLRFAAGDGIIGSFFLWKEGSETPGVFWNELDFEKVGLDCGLESNALFGNPEASHNTSVDGRGDLCGEFHTYAYEWTPDYIAWFVDDTEVRREVGDTAAAFRDNVAGGLRLHFNVWPGDETFGGNFNPDNLPVYQFVNWVQFSAYSNGEFQLQWREDFDNNAMPSGWATANWDSPKGRSTHNQANVVFRDGYAVLALTADNATGFEGMAPMDPDDPAGGGAGGGMTDPGGGGEGSIAEGGSSGSGDSGAAGMAAAGAGAGGAGVGGAGVGGAGGGAGAGGVAGAAAGGVAGVGDPPAPAGTSGDGAAGGAAGQMGEVSGPSAGAQSAGAPSLAGAPGFVGDPGDDGGGGCQSVGSRAPQRVGLILSAAFLGALLSLVGRRRRQRPVLL